MQIDSGSALDTLVPGLAAEMAAARTGHHHRSVAGSMLSADISGFTALSERLASKGRAGAEELTDLINTCFTALIGAAERHGGEVLKFGGDAVLVLFRSDDHPVRAAAAALDMHQALQRLGPARRAGLTMTVGVHGGEFDVYLAGSTHRELVVTGRHATEVIRLEGTAEHGETLVSSSLAARLPAGVAEELPTGDHRLSSPPTDHAGPASSVLGGRLAPVQLPVAPPVDHGQLVPGAVATELAAIDQLGGEHRVVAVGFVLVQGVQDLVEGPDGAGVTGVAEAFGSLVDEIHRIGADYGVTPLHTDIAEDGIKVVLCAGAPLNVGSIADGLILAATEIAAIDSPFVLRQGLQIGRCFAGFLGAPHRRAYTLMGDPVNTAARMLGPANDRQVVAVEDLVSVTRSVYRSEALPPLTVKGKSEPITAFTMTGTTTEVRASRDLGPLVGRDAEAAMIDQLLQARRGILEFVAGAGMGKSRLMDLVRSRAEAVGLPLLHCGARPYATAKPYGVIADLLERALAFDASLDANGRAAALRRRIADLAEDADTDLAGDPAEHVEALAIPLGVDVPQTGALEGLEAAFRRERVNRSIVAVLGAMHPDGMVAVVEDLHWIDDASADVLTHVARWADEHRIAVCCTRRNEGLFAFDEDLSGVTSVELQVLDEDAVRAIANRSATRALSDHELASIVRRAAGNPLFAAEVALAVSESDTGEVPDSVETVIAGRIDRASPQARQVLRVLSVWGDEFQPNEVEPLMADLVAGVDLRTLDLAGIVEPHPDGPWRFTHALHREVAYAGLPYKRRREYHRRIGSYLESRAADPLALASILSVHYDRGGQHDRAWVYCREAGEQAQRQLAQVEATDALRRALNAGRYVDVPNAELADTAIKLGDAAEHAGEYETARWAYRKARRLVAPQDRAHLSTFRKLGIVDERQGRYAAALRWYRKGMAAAKDAKPRPDRGEMLLLTAAMAASEFRRGRTERCWELMEPLAEDPRAPAEVRLRACYLLQLAGTYLEKPTAPRYGELGLQLVDLVRQPVLHGNLVNNLGVAQYFQGRWDAAADLYEESYRLRDGAGDVLGAVMALNNLGEIRSDQHRFTDARRYFDDALRRGRAAKTTFLIHVLEANLGRLATREGEHEAAEELLRTALAGFREIDSSQFVVDTELRLAELDAARGRWDAADDAAEQLLLEAAKRNAGAPETVPLIRTRALAAAAAGDRAGAIALLEEA
ncbi:MAG: adenylate/guanylate cyclase domain-containing protein, partial [Actinomycetota bacterium]